MFNIDYWSINSAHKEAKKTKFKIEASINLESGTRIVSSMLESYNMQLKCSVKFR